MENNNVKKPKGSAYTQPDHIKPKSKWTKKMTIWTIVIAVIVLGILAIIGAENGWFKTKDMIYGKAVVDDYSVIEIDKADVEVADSTIESYLDSVVSHETTTEVVEEGTVEDGDTINLDYSGILVGEEEPFDGGTAESQSLTLGSGTMIDGFEEQIIGHEIGETFDINVTFPEDYSSEDLAGKDAVFTITVNNKTVENVPELTDELVSNYAAEHLDVEINTIEEYEEYYRDKLYNNYLESAIMEAMTEKTDVIYYNEQDLANMKNYSANVLSYYASMFGIDAASYASMMGYDSAEEYADSDAKDTLRQTMMLDKVAEEQGITVTDEEIDAALTKNMESEEYTGTLDEFKAASGDAYLFLVRETDVLLPKVMDYLKQNVVFVESPEEETEAEDEEAEAEDAEDEDADAADEDADAADEDADADAEDAEVEAEDAVEEAIEDAADAVEDVAEDTKDAAEDVADAVTDAVEDAADAVKDATEDAVDTVTDAVEDAADAAKDAAEDAVDTVTDAADAAKDAAEDAVDTVTDAVEDAADAVEDAVEDAADAAKDAAEDAVEDAVDTVTDAVEDAAEEIKE